MPEGRMLKKIISTSLKLAKLKSDSGRLLYTWLLPHLDIEGRFSADEKIVKGYVVPRLKMSSSKIKEYLEDMAKNDLIILYEMNGDKFLQLKKFKDFQLLREGRESKSQIPAPIKDSITTPGVPTENDSTNKVKESKGKVKESKHICDDAEILTPINELQFKWNQFATKNNLSEIRGIIKNSTREGHVKARLSDDNFNFDKLLKAIEKQPFLLGQNKTGFSVTFDWILLPSNYQKIIEGNYIDRKQKFKGIKEWLNEP